ncbi:Cytochrome oxidase biogenesis protein Sco1/SenC/PrrC, putative copper metallochaperone [uncultured Candidatus Thioglobus sp.]|nr:Cytochrome oxidase biogenesis protein Sco1/SenC/PrrC, putative copper metallochaperone [uncultured Candidatus Thioglobus sp.]SMN01337.1 Cytochrome oxidase biogenesis protein Sco1/SenC/PrrC, putative copper metallochaperone [uncultured Candidatus Thioglobus sp.]
MNNKLLSFAFIVIVLLTLSVYFFGAEKNYRAFGKQLEVSHILYKPNEPLLDFSLLDHNNKPFTNENLKGNWTLMLFIYTHCPDVCPTELFDMAQLKKLMEKQGMNAPKVVVVTLDPLRDTPEVLKQYVSHFDKDFLGVTGQKTQIDKLIKPFGAYYERVINDKDGKQFILKADDKLPKSALKQGYIINHTAWIYLINPEGQIFAGFPTPHKASKMAVDIKLITDTF